MATSQQLDNKSSGVAGASDSRRFHRLPPTPVRKEEKSQSRVTMSLENIGLLPGWLPQVGSNQLIFSAWAAGCRSLRQVCNMADARNSQETTRGRNTNNPTLNTLPTTNPSPLHSTTDLFVAPEITP